LVVIWVVNGNVNLSTFRRYDDALTKVLPILTRAVLVIVAALGVGEIPTGC
jgi:hypothetical protein